VAFDEVLESVLRCSIGRRHVEAKTWLERHLEWGQTVSELLSALDPSRPPPGAQLSPGDIVVPPDSKTGLPRVVLNAGPTVVALIDLGKEETISFARDRVVAIE